MLVHGLAARHGETAFAFLVIKLHVLAAKDDLAALIRQIAPMLPDADAFIDELPDDLEESLRIVGMPWLPAEDDDGAEAQRALLAQVPAIDTVWCFQTGTGLPAREEDEDEDDEDDDEPAWSYGPPPQATKLPFAVDGYPGIIDELDWEDFGIAFKLAGPWVAGESTVLLGFHSLWLAPYGGRYRNAAVTIDTVHHTAHLWVDRFAVPSSADEQVHHLLWILSKLHEVTPVLHARFGGATMTQKYGGLMGDTSEPFVLGGNPLLAVHAEGGEAGVDRWIAAQRDWSTEEVAQMLRELAIEIVTEGGEDEEEEEDEEGDDDDDDEEVEAVFEPVEEEREDTAITAGWSDLADEAEEAADEDDDEDDEDDDDDDEEEDEIDRSRHIARYAGEVLAARAAAGRLDPRAADALRPVLEVPEKYEHRRTAVVSVLGALRDRASVPRLIRILDETPIENALDAIGKRDFLVEVATALGAIADPSAIPALAKLVRADGAHNDEPRPAAAEALAACLAAAPEPRDIDDGVLAALLAPIAERNDGEANAALHFAYGRLASVLAPARREAARARLAAAATRRDDATPALARKAALLLAGSGAPDAGALAELRPLVHAALTRLDYAHEYTVRNIRIALRIGEAFPEVVAAEDLAWLTTFTEPDLRARAHALLERIGEPRAPAPVYDRGTAGALADAELAARIADPHVVGRAALIAEAGRRALSAARAGIIAAADAAITRAGQGGANLLDPDTAILAASVKALRAFPLDADAIGLFDRMLRHSNHHVKWELLQDPPGDERLIGGMFHVLGEKWGWQETTARDWLAKFQGSPAYEAERRRDDMN